VCMGLEDMEYQPIVFGNSATCFESWAEVLSSRKILQTTVSLFSVRTATSYPVKNVLIFFKFFVRHGVRNTQ